MACLACSSVVLGDAVPQPCSGIQSELLVFGHRHGFHTVEIQMIAISTDLRAK